MIIKVCGITREEQALEIKKAGATHIGVIHFPKSPRHISLEKIKNIKETVGDFPVVAVVVNPDRETVKKLMDIVDIVQFHGEEDINFIKQFPLNRVFKAFRIKGEEDIERIEPFASENITILIDAFHEKTYGGTGKQINPSLAKKIVSIYPKTILSGGLSPENVESLIQDIKPYGVDASSKLEIKPGEKDIRKVKLFVKRAKDAFKKFQEKEI